MNDKTWDQMSREERAQLMLTDIDTYMELVPEGHWLLLLDPIAKMGPVEPD